MTKLPPDLITISSVIIDDIVLWDGQSYMGTLGGSGTHAAAGMRVWHQGTIGISAFVGVDLPADLRLELETLDLDFEGLVTKPSMDTPRAWQIFEKDGRRSEIFRSEASEFFEFARSMDRVPKHWWNALGCHLQQGGNMLLTLPTLQHLKAGNTDSFVLFEPGEESRKNPPSLWEPVLELADAVFLNQLEGLELTGFEDPKEIASQIQSWGGQNIVIGQGSDGALVRTKAGETWRIEAFPVQAFDTTGGGNALGGGLLAGILQGAEFRAAAQMGAVSASFAVTQVGHCPDLEKAAQEAAERLDWVQDHTYEVN